MQLSVQSWFPSSLVHSMCSQLAGICPFKRFFRNRFLSSESHGIYDTLNRIIHQSLSTCKLEHYRNLLVLQTVRNIYEFYIFIHLSVLIISL